VAVRVLGWLATLPVGLLLLALVLPPVAFGAVARAPRADASQATVTVLEESATIVAAATGESRVAASGEIVQVGDRILTGDPGRVLLTFFDGSEQELQPNSEVLLETMAQTGTGTLTVIAQAAGQTVNRVVAQNDQSSFHLQTPNTTILVRGTRFSASIVRDIASNAVIEEELAVDEGTVEVRLRTETRTLQTGERLTVVPVGGGLQTISQEPAILGGQAGQGGAVDLSGRWMEYNQKEVRIVHRGDRVLATYLTPFICDHVDGYTDIADPSRPQSETTFDFDAQVQGDRLIGSTTACQYGGPSPGIVEVPLELTVSADGNTLDGFWLDDVGGHRSITLTRITE
jgi:hypothetical protein